MGAAIDALSDTWTLLRHNPIILGLGWAASIALAVANFVLALIPLLGRLVSLLLGPAFLAGMLGLAYAGRDGDAGADDFMQSIGDNYLRLLGSTVLFAVVFAVIGGIGVAAAVFVMPTGSSPIGGHGSLATATAFVVPVLVVGVGLSALFLLLQFFDVAIVVNDASVTESFGQSFRMAANDPLSVVGYTLLRGLLGVVLFLGPVAVLASLVGGAVAAAGGLGGGSGMGGLMGAAGIAVVALVLLWLFVLVPLGQVLLLTYHVAFFNRHTAKGTV